MDGWEAALGQPPEDMAALLDRARQLAGRSLGQISDRLGRRPPLETGRAKGWVGQIVEDALGAAAGNKQLPDFLRLQVELKTVPVDGRGRPRESTYITTLSLDADRPLRFEETHLFRKSNSILFIPVEANPKLPISVRRIGNPLLWAPSKQELALLEADWTIFRAKVAQGAVDAITSTDGQVLQIRPKGADASDQTWTVSADGARQKTMRRGIYFRTSFVRQLFEARFLA